MKWSAEQDAALKAVSRWLKTPDRQIFRLFGYAGTGKTTLARHFAESVDGEVLFAAFTGKAAQVMRSRGAENARTLHSLIYRPRGEEASEETGEVSPLFSLSRNSPVAKASLVIVDECSMVDEELGRDLLSFGTPVLVLGDPGQLPPISGGGFFTEAEPDALLTEVHRQARDNPIIALAMDVRLGQTLDYGSYGDSAVIPRDDVETDKVLAADQVLVGLNRTRRRYNQRLRELKGFPGSLPAAGDKLVCLRNNAQKGLLNGSLWQVTHVAASKRKTLLGPSLAMVVKAEDEGPYGPSVKVKVAQAAFEGEGEIPWTVRRKFDEFDYGYALTTHKAQGSQWDEVMLFDESFAFKEHRERWLYTAITRAAERITIVR
ncbi:exodeoxyribonuclease-5 [Rhodobium orientis]|uniref:ATP-binding protein n=1 Tax=Rhodobium orientis TaxID=34017 RepID=A0A327JFT7_9HYPH|nr:ATP-dependent RecD-like DNA helicase [Rhodobium orientis]MBB4305393.1 exodeoxyribonuclease-5 [Rhodobium orientis]MBK5950073.1 ATP-binding protein [Rhodobium orientis]RAI25257.1 ATP-binding protein [Rhodobium orientis]